MPGVRDAVTRASLARALALPLAAMLLCFPLAAARAEATLPDAEWTAIKAIIAGAARRVEGRRRQEGVRVRGAGIRQQFGDAANFLTMVRTAYGALIAARYTEFLEGALIDGSVIQPLRLVAPDNSVRVALYTMQKQPDGRWKISGCVLAPSTVQAA